MASLLLADENREFRPDPEFPASFRVAHHSKLRPPDPRVDHLPAQVRLSAQTDYYPRRQAVVHDLATL